jgi:hypothetical protein
MVPADGESALDVLPFTQLLIDQAATTGAPWRIPPLPETPAGLFGVTDPADLAWLRAMLSDEPVRCFLQPAHLDNSRANAVSRTHIHCVAGAPEGRRPVPATQPNGTASEVWELPTGHDCMITMPVELSQLLLKLAW